GGGAGRPIRRGDVAFGSPPRAWGRRIAAEEPAGHHRFTPTCVGTTHPSTRRASSSSVHPHVRGDDEPTPQESDRHPWFTPTCVGTTRRPPCPGPCPSIPPPVRGADVRLHVSSSRGR